MMFTRKMFGKYSANTILLLRNCTWFAFTPRTFWNIHGETSFIRCRERCSLRRRVAEVSLQPGKLSLLWMENFRKFSSKETWLNFSLVDGNRRAINYRRGSGVASFPSLPPPQRRLVNTIVLPFLLQLVMKWQLSPAKWEFFEVESSHRVEMKPLINLISIFLPSSELKPVWIAFDWARLFMFACFARKQGKLISIGWPEFVGDGVGRCD